MSFHEHGPLYHADGDVVLSARWQHDRDPHSRSVFRVHKAILALYSPVFRDMFVVGGDSASAQYDGAPHVFLTDDGEGIAGLLRALYNPALLLPPRLDPDLPGKLRSIMEVAVKYQVDAISAMIRTHFTADWPCSFREWELREVQVQYPQFSAHLVDHPRHNPPNVHLSLPEPASAIRFALDFNCPAILPAAFYELARMDCMTDWSELNLHHVEGRGARWGLLQGSDLAQLAKGSKTLLAGWPDMIESIKAKVSEMCNKTAESGRSQCITEAAALLARGSDSRYACDPLQFLREADDERQNGEWCCEAGEQAFLEAINFEAVTLWDRLPLVFGLEDIVDLESHRGLYLN